MARDEQVDEKRAVELRETFSRPTHERAPMPPAVASDPTPPRRAGWAQEKARWRSSILDCPLLGDARRAVRARAALAFFVVAWTSYDLVDSLVGDDGVPYYFIFLTNWAACISVAYVLTAVYAARLAARSPPRDPDEHESGPRPDADTGADPPPRVVHALWLVKAPALVAQLFVTIMYWALLYRPSYGPVTAMNVATHGIICAGLIFDHAALHRVRVGGWGDFLACYAFLLTYLAFNVLYTLAIPGATDDQGNPYVYEILAWRTHANRAGAVVAFAAFVVTPICFALATGTSRLRDRWLFPKVEEREGEPRVETGVEMEMIPRDA